MKKNLFTVFFTCFLLAACNTTKKTSNNMQDASMLAGTWELNYMMTPGISFDDLYPNKKPTIQFDIASKKVSGNTGCNNFNGPLKTDGNKISFTDQFALTRMMCPGQGEMVFLENLKKVNTWSVSDNNTLNFIIGDIATMRFGKK